MPGLKNSFHASSAFDFPVKAIIPRFTISAMTAGSRFSPFQIFDDSTRTTRARASPVASPPRAASEAAAAVPNIPVNNPRRVIPVPD
jgi:hypothetical protein